jgi:thioredoxin 1
MSEPSSDELDRIREQKRKKLRQSSADSEVGGQADEEPPDVPIEVGSQGEFQHVVSTYDVVLVDCYADWCGPCQHMEPAVEAIAAETDAAVAKLNVDVHGDVATQLGVRGLPTVIVFSGGEEVERVMGAQDRATLGNMVRTA